MIKPIVTMGDDGDIGQAVQALISDNLSRLNTCFLAKVDSVDENKVNVSFLLGDCKIVIPSVLVGVTQSKAFQQGIKLAPDDVGLCLVCDHDITSYKQSGGSGAILSKRTHDLIDSVFIPLSLFNSNLEDNSIKSEGTFKIEAKEDLSIKGQLLTLQSENASLKKTLSSLAEILAGLTTIPAVQGSNLTLNPDVIVKINQWKAELDTLFKD